jgi:hypothetical protein
MNNYDFARLLSPLRFEQLSRDLLRGQYGEFENFAEGKDGGIDFRYSQANGKILIVQCKKYKDFNSLIQTLKKEVKKLQNLKFTDYLLVTSLDLTDKNKDKIIEIYEGNIQNANQIITNGDLNDLLSLDLNKEVEFKYPELWMTSVNIHQKIFHLGFLKHSDFIKDKLKSSLINFVPYKEYHEVTNHFKNNNIAIISGTPGIGKTTLAHAVISNFIYFQDYQLIDFSYRKIQDAEAYLYSNEPTIFFIDDFLGKIKLDKDNDFAHLLFYFIQKIELLENKKLIVTSREYILKKAHKDLFPIAEINQMIAKYNIELASFTRSVRTEILYNHLKNSRIDVEYIDNLLQNDFKIIIDHKNYNPRIIEHLTNHKLLKNTPVANYFNFFIENLSNPSKIWEHTYDNLPNDLYKLILLVRFLIEEPLPIENLEKAIMNILEKSNRFQQYSLDDFEHITREMEGTFFRFETDEDELLQEEYIVVEFQNPSIIDFIDNIIWEKTNWLNLIIKNSIFFEQLFNWQLVEVVQKNEVLLKSFIEKVLQDFHKLENASFGFFEYDNDEGSFTCWKKRRYNYYLLMFVEVIPTEDRVIDWNENQEVANFLKKELFRYQLDATDDLSEKIVFSEIATLLLSAGLIKSEDAINHYLPCVFDNVKELVYLEYMTRECTEDALSMMKKNKGLIKDADDIFLSELRNLGEKDFMELMDFYDDYQQVKCILPLRKTTKKVKELYDTSMQETFDKLKETIIEDEHKEETKITENIEYYDIADATIKLMFDNIKD